MLLSPTRYSLSCTLLLEKRSGSCCNDTLYEDERFMAGTTNTHTLTRRAEKRERRLLTFSLSHSAIFIPSTGKSEGAAAASITKHSRERSAIQIICYLSQIFARKQNDGEIRLWCVETKLGVGDAKNSTRSLFDTKLSEWKMRNRWNTLWTYKVTTIFLPRNALLKIEIRCWIFFQILNYIYSEKFFVQDLYSVFTFFHFQKEVPNANWKAVKELSRSGSSYIEWFIKNSVSLIGEAERRPQSCNTIIITTACARLRRRRLTRSVQIHFYYHAGSRAHQIECHWFEYLLNSHSVAIIHLCERSFSYLLHWGGKIWEYRGNAAACK